VFCFGGIFVKIDKNPAKTIMSFFYSTGLTRGMSKPLFHRFNTCGYYCYAPSELF